ncbi:MAG: trypsin-like peptidase domain-containing protein [Gemmatimonadales bacterium]
MRYHLTVLTGSRTGLSKEFDQAFVGIGRHPQSDLQLHPDHDLDVSTRHAAILLQGGALLLRDLESANGTFVNGTRITADKPVHSGDVIQLGPAGPKLQLVIEGEPSRVSAETRVGGADKPTPTGATARIRAEVARQTRSLRRTTLALFGCFLLVALGYFLQRGAYESRIEQERATMLAQVDSLSRALGQTNLSLGTLRAQADSAQQEAQALRARIQDGGNATELDNYRRQLAAAIARQQGIVSAATLDAAHIDSLNGNAVGLVIVHFPDDSVFTGTGFVVARDDSGAWLLTNRHVVRRENGEVANELGVVFNHSNQEFQGEVVTIHASADLALIRVGVKGGVDPVHGVEARPIPVGSPVATIGFPLGLDLSGGGDWRKLGVAATVGVATISRTLPNLIQLDGYGATGASGSPIFDRNGNVVAVLYGGERETNGRIVYTLPIKLGIELLHGRVPGF